LPTTCFEMAKFIRLAKILGSARALTRSCRTVQSPVATARLSLAALRPGLWRSHVLLRLVFLASAIDLPVEEESLPLHVIGKEPPATEREVARLVVERPELQTRYGGWLATLHPAAWEEPERTRKAAAPPVSTANPLTQKLASICADAIISPSSQARPTP
jgi:hypothetical protein